MPDFEVVSPPKWHPYSLTGMSPANAIYFSEDDRLELGHRSSSNSINITVDGRFVDRNGEVHYFQEVFTSVSSVAFTLTRWKLGEGFLLSLRVSTTSTTLRRGNIYARVRVRRGADTAGPIVQTLLQGYLTSDTDLVWPEGRHEHAFAGHGLLRSITGTDPAAGVEISETVPTGRVWRLVSMRFALVADATVINRIPVVTLDDGTNVFFASQSSNALTASLSRNYTASAQGGKVTNETTEDAILLPPDLYLFQGWRIRTATTGLQAGDNYGAPQLMVEEWLQQ